MLIVLDEINQIFKIISFYRCLNTYRYSRALQDFGPASLNLGAILLLHFLNTWSHIISIKYLFYLFKNNKSYVLVLKPKIIKWYNFMYRYENHYFLLTFKYFNK